METFLREFRYSLRTLAKAPGFSVVAILTLALGIGASTAIFSVVDAVLLRPLPYRNPEALVRVWEQGPTGHRMNLADLNFDDFRAQNNTFSNLAAYGYLYSSIAGGSEPVRVTLAEVSKDFFPVLGVEPFLGRTFVPEEQRLHGTPAVIVSYGYWQRYLGGSTDLSQFHLRIGDGVYTVAGVMPAEFAFPAEVAAWIPRELSHESSGRRGHNWRGLGRLRDGVTVGQARANLSAIAQRLRAQYGKGVDLTDAAVVSLTDAVVGDVRTALLTLLGAVGLLLLVACANVAGLLLARGTARRKELAVRVALGAGRGRLLQQFLAESFALSLAGGICGVLIASWGVRALPAILPANLPRQEGVAMNTPVLLFALCAMTVLAVSLGLFGAWRAGNGQLRESLTAGSRSYTGGASQRMRGFLVVGEIATTLVILAGAGLLGRSFLQLISTSAGFNPQNLITMEFLLQVDRWKVDPAVVAHQVQVTDEILSRLRALPGVEAAGIAGALPVAAGDDLASGDFLLLNGQKPPANFEEWGRMAQNSAQTGHASYAIADEQYFHTMGIPLVRGRAFSKQDDGNAPHVAVISQSLARQRWPDQDPIGQVIDFGNMDGNLKPLTIVGIVGDIRDRGLDAPPSSIIYVAYRQRGMNPNSTPVLLLRSGRSTGEIVSSARAIFHDAAPDVPVKFSTFTEQLGGWLADRRFLLLLVGLFAAAALTLAAVGIYGVVAFSVTRRTQEIGIRMALGAHRGSVLRLVVGEGARLALAGVAIGMAAAIAVTRLLSSLLFGVTATDPLTYAAVSLLLTVVALLASYLPARRAMRLDPTIALRYD